MGGNRVNLSLVVRYYHLCVCTVHDSGLNCSYVEISIQLTNNAIANIRISKVVYERNSIDPCLGRLIVVNDL